MNCEQMMELMQRFVDEDLTQTEEQSLMDHISQCPECAASFEQLKRLSAELSLLPMVLPPFSIVDSILPKLAEIDAQQAAIHVAYMPTANRSKMAIFSWKAAAGFVAAAAIISLIAINLTPSLKQDASEMMQAAKSTGSASKGNGKSVEGAAAKPEESASKQGANDSADISGFTIKKPDTVQTDKSSGLKSEPAAKTNDIMKSPIDPSATPSANQTLKSADGNFIAVVERQIVQVQTPEGNRIYTSSIHWKPTDTIQLLLWQDNKYLTYDVKMEDGQVKRFIIDPILKTEQEQKN
jgi:hypothetical protein